MPKLKRISGKGIISILQRLGFQIITQKGSHVKLGRTIPGSSQTITIPNHKELDKGTLKAIYNKTLKYVPEQELRKHFYTK